MADTVIQYIIDISTGKARSGLKKTAQSAKSAAVDIGEMGNSSKKSTDQLSRLGDQSRKVAKDNQKLSGSMLVSADAFFSLAGRALGAVDSLIKFGQSQADLVNDLNDLANRSGLATDSIQALQFSFQASGQSADGAKKVIDKMPRLMADLMKGTGSAAKAFDSLGLSVRHTDGTLKSSDQVLTETISVLQGFSSQSEKAAVASQIFGRSAGDLLQAMGQTEGLQTFTGFIREFGVDTGPEASKQAAEFQQAIAMLNVVLGSLGQAAISVFGQKGLIGLMKIAGGAIVDLGVTISGLAEFVEESFERMGQFGEQVAIQWQLDFNRAAMRIAEAISLIPGVEIDITDQQKAFDEASKKLDEFTQQKVSFPTITDSIEKALNDGFRAQEKFKKRFDQTIADIGKITASADPLPAGGAEEISSAPPDIKKEVEEVAKSADQMTLTFDQAMKMLDESIKSFRIAMAVAITDLTTEGIGAIAGGTASMLQFGAGFAGPGVQAGVGAVTAIAELGKKTPEEIQQEMEMFTQAFVNGIATLPEVLIKVLPPMLVRLTGAIIKALFQLPILFGEAILEGIKLIVKAIKDFFTRTDEEKEAAKEARKQRRSDRKEARQDWWSDLMTFQGGGRYIPSAQSGLRFTGQQSGLAILHPGETVVPQSGQMSQITEGSLRQQMGNSVSININSAVVESNAIDGLVRKIEERFLQFGNSRSPLFGN